MAPHYFPLVYAGVDGETQKNSEAVRDLVSENAASQFYADPSASKLCIMCENEGTQMCGKCSCAQYCSAVCQRNDWPIHKMLCEAFMDFKPSERPSPNHFRAVVLPVNRNKPECIWLQYDHQHGTMVVDHPDLDDFAKSIGHTALPLSDGFCLPINDASLFKGKQLGQTICLLGLATTVTKKQVSLLNEGHSALGKTALLHPLFGPLIHVAMTRDDKTQETEEASPRAGDQPTEGNDELPGVSLTKLTSVPPLNFDDNVKDDASGEKMGQENNKSPQIPKEDSGNGKGDARKNKGTSTTGDVLGINQFDKLDHNPIRVQDITMRDFRHFVDFYHHQPFNPCIISPKRTTLFYIPAIKINNVTDPFNIKMGVSKATATRCANVPGVTFHDQYPAILANLVGLRWWVRSGDFLMNEGVHRPWSNEDARHLDAILTKANPDGEAGVAAAAFPLKGSLLVIHVQGLPLLPDHIRAFNKYMDLVFLTGGIPSKKGCSAYWQKYKVEQERAGICMEDVYSPYTLEDIEVGEDVELQDVVKHDAVLLRRIVSGNPGEWMAAVRAMRKR